MAFAKKAHKEKPFKVFLPLGSRAYWANDDRNDGDTSFKGDIPIAAGVTRDSDDVKNFNSPEEALEHQQQQDIEVANPDANG